MKKILIVFGSIVLLSGSALFLTSNVKVNVSASALQNIVITDHPTKGLDRRADLISFYWCAKDSFIAQKYYVYELDLNGNRDPFSRYEVTLYASNAWLVNPSTGELLMSYEEYIALPIGERPSNVMGEYDFFLRYAENPIKLYELLLAKVNEADLQRQRFNR